MRGVSLLKRGSPNPTRARVPTGSPAAFKSWTIFSNDEYGRLTRGGGVVDFRSSVQKQISHQRLQLVDGSTCRNTECVRSPSRYLIVRETHRLHISNGS